MDTSELIKFGIFALIIVIIASLLRRGQAHSTPVPPDKSADATDDATHPCEAG